MSLRVGRPPVSVYYDCKIITKDGETIPISDILFLDLLGITESPYSVPHPLMADFKLEEEETIMITEGTISKYKEKIKDFPEDSDIRKWAEENLELLKRAKFLIVRKVYMVSREFDEDIAEAMKEGLYSQRKDSSL